MVRILLLFLLPVSLFGQKISYRHYRPGEVWHYRLISESWQNEQFSGKTISVSEHTVVNDAGFPEERVRWISKTNYKGRDSTRMDSIAQKVPPYRISLSPEAKLALPPLRLPEMTGEITDLHTFYVAVSPLMNIQRLSRKDTIFKNEKPVQGNFSDNNNILYGKDHILVTQHLLSLNKRIARVRTDFLPPDRFGLDPLIDTLPAVSRIKPNNFIMLQKGADGSVNLLWGVEYFIITTKLDNRTGRILEATMDNFLELRMRYRVSEDRKSWAAEFPLRIRRSLKLEGVKD